MQIAPDEELYDPNEPWSIQNLETADWALGRIADMQREIEENKVLEAAALTRVKLRAGLLNEKAMRGIRFFESRLQAFAEANRELLLKGGKKKSRDLINGVLSWRKTGGKLEVKDATALLEWARVQPVETGVLRITEAPALDEIKKLFKTTGELPPGTDISPEGEEFQVKATSMGEANE